MDLIVENRHLASWGKRRFLCAVGKNGLIDAQHKREGDGKTPVGRWPMREILYRSDRLQLPKTLLPTRPIQSDDAWCEDPKDPHYNQRVSFAASKGSDRLWREDHLYDIIVVLGHNDNPVKPNYGSAIFLHLARPDFGPSIGCVTLALSELLNIVGEADLQSCVDVKSTL